jgi:hypothetical protein
MYICDGAGVLPMGSSEWEGGKKRGEEVVGTIEGRKKEGKRKVTMTYLPCIHIIACLIPTT